MWHGIMQYVVYLATLMFFKTASENMRVRRPWVISREKARSVGATVSSIYTSTFQQRVMITEMSDGTDSIRFDLIRFDLI